MINAATTGDMFGQRIKQGSTYVPPASDLNFLSLLLHDTGSFPQGVLVLGQDFNAALNSCLDKLPAKLQPFKASFYIEHPIQTFYRGHSNQTVDIFVLMRKSLAL